MRRHASRMPDSALGLKFAAPAQICSSHIPKVYSAVAPLFPRATSQVAACRHLATAARVKYHSVLRTHCALQCCKFDTPLLAAGSLICKGLFSLKKGSPRKIFSGRQEYLLIILSCFKLHFHMIFARAAKVPFLMTTLLLSLKSTLTSISLKPNPKSTHGGNIGGKY